MKAPKAPFYKAVLLEVMVLVDSDMADADIEECVEAALYDYCMFYGGQVDVSESYEGVVALPKKAQN